MPRYIDADDFYKRLSNPPYTIYNGDMFAEWFEECFKTQPTADVEPVRHGRWIEHPDDIFPLESTIECSVSGEQENVDIHNDNFCPNCGAKMDGGEQE